jgi:hypothetical protein
MTGAEKTNSVLRERESQTDVFIEYIRVSEAKNNLPASSWMGKLRVENMRVDSSHVDELREVVAASELHENILASQPDNRYNTARLLEFVRLLKNAHSIRAERFAGSEYQRLTQLMNDTLHEISERRCMRLETVEERLSDALERLQTRRITDVEPEKARLLDMSHHMGRKRFRVFESDDVRRSSSLPPLKVHMTPDNLNEVRARLQVPRPKEPKRREQRLLQFLTEYIKERLYS